MRQKVGNLWSITQKNVKIDILNYPHIIIFVASQC
jgi:hypothetical protein